MQDVYTFFEFCFISYFLKLSAGSGLKLLIDRKLLYASSICYFNLILEVTIFSVSF